MEDQDLQYSLDLSSDGDPWPNESFWFNVSAVNTSSVSNALFTPAIDNFINVGMIVGLFLVMVSLGCTMEVSKIKNHIVRPKGMAIAMSAQYCIMPLTAFCLAKAFQLDENSAVVVLICGCCPGGTISNVLALALQGDMNLSIVMTSFSTLLALGMMPLLLYIYCQGFPELRSMVPYGNIIISLVMILIPCGVGVFINYYRPKYAKIITKVGGVFLVISILVISIGSCVVLGSKFLLLLSPSNVSICFLLPFIGYSFGYILSSAFKLSQRERRTVAVETGCQNIQLGATILKLAFPPEMIGTLFLFPFLFFFFQVMEGSLLAVMFRCYRRFRPEEKETYQQTDTGEKAEGSV